MTIDVRKELEMIGKYPGMYGITREALFVHVHVLLHCVGIERDAIVHKLGKVGNPPIITGNTFSETVLLTPIVTHDPWAQELSAAALELLPEGSGIYEVKQVVPFTIGATPTHEDQP